MFSYIRLHFFNVLFILIVSIIPFAASFIAMYGNGCYEDTPLSHIKLTLGQPALL